MNRRLLLVVLLLVLFASLIICFIDRIAVFSINHLTDYEISYDKSEGNLFGTTRIYGLRFEVTENDFVLTAETAYFDLELKRSVLARKLVWDCWLEDVRLPGGEEDVSDLTSDPMFALPFDPGSRYRFMAFTALLTPRQVEIEDFKAVAENPQSGIFRMNFERLEISFHGE